MKILNKATDLNYILAPCLKNSHIDINSSSKKAAGIALFILLGISTGGISVIILLAKARHSLKNGPKHRDYLQSLNGFAKRIKSLNNSSMENSIDKVKKILKYKNLELPQSFENHLFHDHITSITYLVKNDKKLKKIWAVFLNTIDHLTFTYPSGKQVVLDVKPEKALLEQKKANNHKISFETMDETSANYQQELKEIFNIFNESFSWKVSESFFINDIKTNLKKVLLVRDSKNGEILGYSGLSLNKEAGQKVWCMRSFARKANAAKRGVGNFLMEKLVQEFFSKQSVYLQVRENNEIAIDLYKKYGFKIVKQIDGYYRYPDENAYIMRLEAKQVP